MHQGEISSVFLTPDGTVEVPAPGTTPADERHTSNGHSGNGHSGDAGKSVSATSNLPALRTRQTPETGQISISGDSRNGLNGDGTASPLQPLIGFVELLRRRLWLVLAVTTAVFGVAAYKAYWELPTYRATAVIRLSDERWALSGSGDEADATGTPRQDRDPEFSLIQLLRSRGIAREVVEKEGLRLQVLSRRFPMNLLNPHSLPAASLKGVRVSTAAPDSFRFRLHFSEGEVTARGSRSTAHAAYGAPLELPGVRFTVAADPGIESADLAVVPLGGSVRTLLKNLSGEPRERTDVIDVHYTTNDPHTAQRVVNTAVRVFQASNASAAQQQSARRRRFIENQVKRTDTLLMRAEQALSAFRSREHLYSSQERLLAQQSDLTGLKVRRGELAADRQMHQNLLTALERRDRGVAPGERLSALASAPEIAENPVVSELYEQLARYHAEHDSLTAGTWGNLASHPDVKRLDTLIASTESKIATAARGQIAAIDARLASLDELISRSAAEMSALPRKEGEQAQLVQRVETYRRTAEQLQEKLQQAQIEEAVEIGQVEVVDLADLPPTPIGGSRTVKLMFGLVLGLLLGGGSAYFLENRKSVFRRQAELEAALRIPSLALIPRLKAASGNGRHSLGQLEKNLRGAEAYRMLRTNLLFSESVQALKTLVITSAEPQEGKTTTAANLAVAYAQQGYLVLLVDCDLRCGRVHELFKLPLEPGLTELLLGQKVPTEVIRSTPVEQLFVLPAGALPPHPSELVGSARLQEALTTLLGTFDIIILDSPPVLVVPEAGILSKQADGVLVVVRADHTEREVARRAVYQLTTLGARVVGSVLNGAEGKDMKYDAYYENYHRVSSQEPVVTGGKSVEMTPPSHPFLSASPK
jgi:succinoglycan biosynthesis transport protein ExoP